jgi:putative transposase
MCEVLCVHPSGYYAWLKAPLSQRAKDDAYYLGFIKQFWLESGCNYGYRNIYLDMQSIGESCGKNRVHRIMQAAKIKSLRGYKHRQVYRAGAPSAIAANHLDRAFDVSEPNRVWGTDITYIRTYEGWLFLCVVIDLYSRQVIGWSMDKSINTDLVLNALLMAIWRRKPKQEVLVHSDQGCQYTSYDWRSFLKTHKLKASMSRKGNCHDNSPVESFFSLLKRERVKRRIYPTREAAKADIFDFIEMVYNVKRRHSHCGGVSPAEYEKKYFEKLKSV